MSKEQSDGSTASYYELPENATELQELISNVTDIDNAKIIAERNVYTGAELKINKAIWKADENRGKSVFTALRRKMSVTTR